MITLGNDLRYCYVCLFLFCLLVYFLCHVFCLFISRGSTRLANGNLRQKGKKGIFTISVTGVLRPALEPNISHN